MVEVSHDIHYILSFRQNQILYLIPNKISLYKLLHNTTGQSTHLLVEERMKLWTEKLMRCSLLQGISVYIHKNER